MRLRDVATVERLPMPASQPPSSSAAPSSAVRDMPQLNIHYVPSRLPAGIVVGLWGDAVMRQTFGIGRLHSGASSPPKAWTPAALAPMAAWWRATHRSA